MNNFLRNDTGYLLNDEATVAQAWPLIQPEDEQDTLDCCAALGKEPADTTLGELRRYQQERRERENAG